MSAFREYFLDKYFGYRSLYVAAVAAQAPNRRSLAVAAEIARLSFMIVGNLLCAGILWALVVGAIGRFGFFAPWPIVFALLAAVPTAFASLATRGVGTALADRR